jgi:LPS-assembly protein
MAVKRIPFALLAGGLLIAQASSSLLFADDKIPQAKNTPSGWQCVASGSGWECSEATPALTGPYAKAPLPKHKANSSTAMASDSERGSDSKLVQTASNKEAAKLDWVPRDQLPPELAAQTPALCEGTYVQPTITSTSGLGVEAVDSPVQVSANQTSFTDGVYTLSGDILVKQGQQQIESDQATFDQNTNVASLDGDVRYRQPDLLVLGDKASMDLNQGEIKVENSQFVIHSAHARGAADEITKQGDNIIRVKNGVYTSCPPNSNTWTLNSQNIKLNPTTGWGSATNATLNVKDVPILYTPYFYFPIDDRRQTGLLYPKISISSGDGLDVATPYYFNLAPNYDALYTPRFIADRGLLNEGQFRYLTPWGKGDIGGAYISDDRSYGGSRSINNWNHETDFSDRWSTLVDYTHVSDKDYFKDLGTDLNTQRSSFLDQLAQTQYSGDNWKFLGKVQKYQTIDTEIPENEHPFERLPNLVLESDLPSQNGLHYLWRSEYDYFSRDLNKNNPSVVAANGDLVKGSRYQATPGMRLPMENAWGYLTPEVKVNAAYYDLSDNAAGDDNQINRAIPTVSVDSGLYFDRLTTIGAAGYHQTLEPRIYYTETPYHNQDDVPIFDTSEINMTYQQLFRSNNFTGNDRIADDEHVTIGLSSRLLEDASGFEKLRASIGQGIYLKDQKVALNSPSKKQAQAPLASEIIYRFDRDWRMQLDTVSDSKDSTNDLAGVNFYYNPSTYEIFNVGYQYSSNESTAGINNGNINQSNMSFSLPLNHEWNLLSQWRYDVASSTSLETLAGFEYNSCCWGLRFVARHYLNEDVDSAGVVTKSSFDNGIYLQFEFKGLGSLGKKSDGVISESIYGYDNQNETYDLEKNGHY